MCFNLYKAELSACDNAKSFLQSGFWGSFKARFGWEALAFKVEQAHSANTSASPASLHTSTFGSVGALRILSDPCELLVLRRSLFAGFSLAYIPWGPELPESCQDKNAALGELALALKAELPKDTVFIRFDPPWFTEGLESPPYIPPPFIRASADIQPPDTVLIDLKQPMESIMEQMKPKWRYNARLAMKKGVIVRKAEPEDLDTFYTLLKETARRDGIAIHSINYYKTLFELTTNNSPLTTSLYLAEHEGETLAGIVTLFRGREAVYLYGASSDTKLNLMAPYALQVKAMEDAKTWGCEEYDLFGIPPNEDPSHPMAGLYRFKTGFGGRIIHRPGSWDYLCSPVLYRMFRGAEALRKSLRTMRKRRG